MHVIWNSSDETFFPKLKWRPVDIIDLLIPVLVSVDHPYAHVGNMGLCICTATFMTILLNDCIMIMSLYLNYNTTMSQNLEQHVICEFGLHMSSRMLHFQYQMPLSKDFKDIEKHLVLIRVLKTRILINIPNLCS